MARWEAGTRERLQCAALDLFTARGYDGVTVAEIAAGAGTTERTFFRHYADKREVLFRGEEDFQAAFLAGVAAAPAGDPLSLAVAGLTGGGAHFGPERHPWARARQQVIDAHPALQERELLKLSALAAALTGALTDRGVAPVPAALAAESAVTVFRTAFATWIAEDEARPFLQVQDAVLAELHALLGRD